MEGIEVKLPALDKSKCGKQGGLTGKNICSTVDREIIAKQ